VTAASSPSITLISNPSWVETVVPGCVTASSAPHPLFIYNPILLAGSASDVVMLEGSAMEEASIMGSASDSVALEGSESDVIGLDGSVSDDIQLIGER